MCTLIMAHHVIPGVPLLVGHNRDERYDRESAPATWWRPMEKGPMIWSPRDLIAHGTWIGVNADGVFAGLTNRFGETRADAPRSRGAIVIEALMHHDVENAVEAITRLDPAEFSGFHLFLADRQSAYRLWHTGDAIVSDLLDPGVHLLTERSLGAGPTAREEYVRTRLDDAQSVDVDFFKDLLTTQRGLALDDVLVDVPELDYGTRSSTIVRFGEERENVRLLFAEGGF